MSSALDIWRAANLPIGQHGAGALSEATRWASHMLYCGDRKGWHVWPRVGLAIEALQAPRRGKPN